MDNQAAPGVHILALRSKEKNQIDTEDFEESILSPWDPENESNIQQYSNSFVISFNSLGVHIAST